jgi:DNA adenine methylase
LPKKTLFYFDPPYFVKGKDLYLNFYNTKDHKEIADEVGLINQKWIVTYDNVPTIRDLYKDFRQMDYRLSYSSSKPNKGEEIMIFSDNIYISEYPVI